MGVEEQQARDAVYAVYALLANAEDRHDLRFLGTVESSTDDTMGGEMRFEKEIDALVKRLTDPLPRAADATSPDPWDMLPGLLGAGGDDAFQAIVAWPVSGMRQVNRPDRRPFRMGWPGGKAMTVRSL